MMMLARVIIKRFKLTPDAYVELPLAKDHDEDGKPTKKVGDYVPQRLYKLQCRQLQSWR